MAAGWYHSLALKADGTVWAWGYNFYGQLGNDTNAGKSTPNPTPQQVLGLPAIIAIAAGESHSLALAADGTVWGWGWNYYGQLGTGTNNLNNSPNPPTQISGLSNVTAISAGGYHSLAMTSNGTVWAWGYNFYGQLGNSTNNSSPSANPPAAIPSMRYGWRLEAGSPAVRGVVMGSTPRYVYLQPRRPAGARLLRPPADRRAAKG